MTLSLVQHASGAANTSTVTITLAATGAGNALIVAASYNDTGTDEALASVTLGGSGSGFSSQYYRTGAEIFNLNIWADFSITGGQTSLVVTGQSGSTELLSVDVWEVSGGLVSLDKTAAGEADGTGATWTSGATATTSVAAEFVVGIVAGQNNAGSALTFTGPASPWVNESQLSVATSDSQLCGYQITSSTGAFTYSGTANTTGTNLFYAAAVATFRSSAAAPGAKFYQRTTAVQAKRQKQPQQGRIRSGPGGPASTHIISSSGRLVFSPFGMQGLSLFSYGLLVTTQALLVLDAILLQEPVTSANELNLCLGTGPPTATTPMTQLLNGNGYVVGGQACAFNAASGGTSTNSTTVSWTNTSGGWEITGLEFWDPGTGERESPPVRWLYADWSGAPVAVAAGNSFVIPSGSLEISLS